MPGKVWFVFLPKTGGNVSLFQRIFMFTHVSFILQVESKKNPDMSPHCSSSVSPHMAPLVMLVHISCMFWKICYVPSFYHFLSCNRCFFLTWNDTGVQLFDVSRLSVTIGALCVCPVLNDHALTKALHLFRLNNPLLLLSFPSSALICAEWQEHAEAM